MPALKKFNLEYPKNSLTPVRCLTLYIIVSIDKRLEPLLSGMALCISIYRNDADDAVGQSVVLSEAIKMKDTEVIDGVEDNGHLVSLFREFPIKIPLSCTLEMELTANESFMSNKKMFSVWCEYADSRKTDDSDKHPFHMAFDIETDAIKTMKENNISEKLLKIAQNKLNEEPVDNPPLGSQYKNQKLGNKITLFSKDTFIDLTSELEAFCQVIRDSKARVSVVDNDGQDGEGKLAVISSETEDVEGLNKEQKQFITRSHKSFLDDLERNFKAIGINMQPTSQDR
ncbi:hypothetical protein [Alteromonas sp. CNT1-28]|uniref:hypothetical protein n=2 Tax=unclassified Alteromonas TaxID=2614992 RepID=UPI001EF27A02|nr:hypothetical protein [Alteromonas sp. CNT1-28]MCG7638096.1 hypothetical protein [Alteromonas sp. CNT1-28]